MERNELLARLRERIFRFAASRLSGDAAEDVAQEVLVVIEEKYAALDRVEDLLPVSLEIARFKIWAVRRKAARRGEHNQISVDDLPLAGVEPDPFDQALRRERIERLEAALSQLGERCREIFRMKLEGCRFPEIQKKMRVPLNTLYTWDLRCRKRIQQLLEGDGR